MRTASCDEDGAVAALEKSLEAYGPSARGRMRVHPEFTRLHGNPRFDRITAPYRKPA